MALDRDFPVPMDDLRRASAEALLAPLKARADELEAEMVDELAGRMDRLINLANVLDEHWLDIRHLAMQYIAYEEIKHVDAVEEALKALRPGDRDPLP